jgi:hypothetical protein
MEAKKICNSIARSDLDPVELDFLIDSVKKKRGQLARDLIRMIHRGTKVTWDSDGNTETGVVTKIGTRLVLVKSDSGTVWKVPAGMLSVA